MPNSKSSRNIAQRRFGRQLFQQHPEFRPTRAIYIDFEGSGGGYEQVISLYWPQNAGTDRFSMAIARAGEDRVSVDQLVELWAELGVWDQVESAVVFSGGVEIPDEAKRFHQVFGEEPLVDIEWVNLHWVLRQCEAMKRVIRETKNVVYTKRKKAHYSLEALEWEFGFKRPPPFRSIDNQYSDGKPGQMKILELVQEVRSASASLDRVAQLDGYCRWDVESMFKIARKCEKLATR